VPMYPVHLRALRRAVIFLASLAIAVEVLWLAMAGVCWLVYRPGSPPPGPETTELGNEPPAVVNLLTHAFRVTSEAASATLLSLADRRMIEIVQISPEAEIIQLRRRARDSHDLRPYEQQVLAHLQLIAVDGVVPADALTTGPSAVASSWWKTFRRAVVADARDHGLCQPRFPKLVQRLLGVGGAIGLGATYLLIRLQDEDKNVAPVFVSIALLFAMAVATTRWDRQRQRGTAAGMAAAARWLGVARAYQEVDTYRDLPPAAVVLHERHLAYAVATGVARLAVERLPFGAEDDRVAWSHAGNRWRLVHVRYPRRRAAWGMSPAAAIATGLLWSAILVGIGWFSWRIRDAFLDVIHRRSDLFDTVDDPTTAHFNERIVTLVAVGIAVAVFLGVLTLVVHAIRRGPLVLARALADLGAPPTCKGLVVRRRTWCTERKNRRVCGHFAAIDDGTQENLIAYRLPAKLQASVRQGDHVTAAVTRHLGFVRTLTVLPR
jgi:Predicted membrane protein (DUF2207) C-terminal domain